MADGYGGISMVFLMRIWTFDGYGSIIAMMALDMNE
jgi:hypothetical protein